jgi:hypothetical protein
MQNAYWPTAIQSRMEKQKAGKGVEMTIFEVGGGFGPFVFVARPVLLYTTSFSHCIDIRIHGPETRLRRR